MADGPGLDVGSALTEPLGPLPTWVWLTGLTGLGLVYYLYEKHKAGSGAASGQLGSSPVMPAASQSTVEGTSYIPDYVFQNYNEFPAQQPEPVTVQFPSSLNVNVGQQQNPPTTTGGGAFSLASWKPKTGSYQQVNAYGANYGAWVSTGQYSLNTIAKSHGVTPQQIVQASTTLGGTTPQAGNPFVSYASRGNFNAPLPKGARIAIPLPGAVGQPQG